MINSTAFRTQAVIFKENVSVLQSPVAFLMLKILCQERISSILALKIIKTCSSTSKEGTDLSGNVKLVHHFQLIVHLNATFHQIQLTVIKVTEVKLEDLSFLRVWQNFRLWNKT